MKNYKQTTKFSGLASALMIIINHFNSKFSVDRKNEFRLWRESVLLPSRGSCIFRLGIIANRLKVPVKIIVEDPKYKLPQVYKFRIFSKKEIYDAKFMSDINLEESKNKSIVDIRNFTLDEVKEALKNHKLVLLRVNMGPLIHVRTVPDYILLYGYGNNLYLWNNTLKGETMRINEKLMKECFMQVKTKCKRDNRVIIFG